MRVALVALLGAVLGMPVVVAVACTAQRALGASVTPVAVALTALAALVGLALWGRAGGGPVAAIARRLSPDWDGAARRRRWLAALWVMLAVVAAVQTSRLACFMSDPALRWGSVFPPVEEGVGHACMSAYVQAADLSRRGVDNLYADQYYPAYLGGTLGHTARMESPVDHLSDWLEDPYEYPPPFLLIPRAGLALTNDYLVLRTAWFAVKLVVVFGVLLLVAGAVGGARGRVALLLVPALASSLCFGFDLQFGQAHFIAIALAVAAMLAFARGRDGLGGALLGFAIVTKLFPGLLVLYLIGLRRWRAVLSAALWSLAWALLALAVLGWAPFEAFVGYQLPRISSGEAFAFFLRSDLTIATNWGVYGIPVKLGRLGVPGMSVELGSLLSWIYTIPVILAAVVASRRRVPVVDQPVHWIALLALASLRSPLAPNVYVGVPALWLLSLLAVELRGARAIALFVATWIAIAGLPPLPGPEATILLWMVGQVAMFAVCFWVVFRAPRKSAARPETSGAGGGGRRGYSGGNSAGPQPPAALVAMVRS